VQLSPPGTKTARRITKPEVGVQDEAIDTVIAAVEQVRRDIDSEHAGHEGELTAARRLIDSLHDTYGTFIDAFVLDALYANGSVMTQLAQHGYGGFVVLKKDNNEPLKEALALWQEQGPCEQYQDADKKEHLQFWDSDDIETLDTYKGKVRVIRAVVSKPDKEPSRTWCFAIVGKRPRRLARRTALQIIRSRWHIEDTGFNQWIKYWNFGHVFGHTPNALTAVFLLWMRTTILEDQSLYCALP
jgi:hypothetical protein